MVDIKANKVKKMIFSSMSAILSLATPYRPDPTIRCLHDSSTPRQKPCLPSSVKPGSVIHLKISLFFWENTWRILILMSHMAAFNHHICVPTCAHHCLEQTRSPYVVCVWHENHLLVHCSLYAVNLSWQFQQLQDSKKARNCHSI